MTHTAELHSLSWSSVRRIPELTAGEIHVWRVSSRREFREAVPFTSLLSTDERRRAGQFRFEKDRRLYVAAHGALRALLGAYEGVNAGEIQLVSGAHGKPMIAAPATSDLQFNLSHSHELALVAVTRGRAIGVDIEQIKYEFAFEEIAGRFFTPRETDVLSALPKGLHRAAFFKCWTSKEAFLKAKATGLSGALDEVEIVLDAKARVGIRAQVPGWSLLELPQLIDYAASVVVEGEALPMRCHEW
jgi:4'-phosphopantetheinyl transferase